MGGQASCWGVDRTRAVLAKVPAQPGSSGPIGTRTTFKIRKTKVPKLESIVHSQQFGKSGFMVGPGQLAGLTLARQQSHTWQVHIPHSPAWKAGVASIWLREQCGRPAGGLQNQKYKPAVCTDCGRKATPLSALDVIVYVPIAFRVLKMA